MAEPRSALRPHDRLHHLRGRGDRDGGAARRRRPRPGALRRAEAGRGAPSRRRWSSRSSPVTGCWSTPGPRSRRAAMKFVEEFRDAELGKVLAGEILAAVDPDRHYKLMEVCGGHTHSIYRYGIDDLLPENVELVHGPGCPVCVIPMGRVDDGIAIARNEEVIFTCFGDMMRVPGSEQSLLEAKAEGADVRMVYSPLDALRLAKANPDREVVFFAIGFETTAPSTALTMKRAQGGGRLELLLHVQPRDDRAAAAGAARLARPAARRLHRPRSRLDRGRRQAVRVHPRRLRQAGRDLGLRAARHPADGADDPPPARRGPLRGREPVHPGRPLRGQPAGARGDVRGLRAAAALRVARARASSPRAR